MRIHAVRADIRENYELWRKSNTKLMDQIETLTKQFIKDNMRFSYRDMIAFIRWHDYYTGERKQPYKISHTFTPYIARDMMEKYPAVQKLIETRPVRADINLN